jgi:predicted short-subunit dehydrogenase-like oxidoreductase (DUF2520 family)
MNFSIVGTGNMAWFLAEKLSVAGHHFEGIYGRNIIAANEIASQYPTRIYSGPEEIPDKEDHICLLAVKDDAIGSIAAQVNFTETVLAHTAGAVSIKLLAGAAAQYGVVWPVYSITRNRHFLRDDIPLVTEGNNERSSSLIGMLSSSISRRTVALSETQRFRLHMAAVFANNFSNHVIALSEELCADQQIPFDYLKPLVEQTFERIAQHPAKDLQTGPAIRNDGVTMQKHMASLKKERPQFAAVYESLSISIRKMYENDDQ